MFDIEQVANRRADNEFPPDSGLFTVRPAVNLDPRVQRENRQIV
jgi:hypothetical protein